jgi:hypothetical protein
MRSPLGHPPLIGQTRRLHSSGYGKRIAASCGSFAERRVSNASTGIPVLFKQRTRPCAISATPKLWRIHFAPLSPLPRALGRGSVSAGYGTSRTKTHIE